MEQCDKETIKPLNPLLSKHSQSASNNKENRNSAQGFHGKFWTDNDMATPAILALKGKIAKNGCDK
jgi:hypothetical protein